jgi:hypothetical protein
VLDVISEVNLLLDQDIVPSLSSRKAHPLSVAEESGYQAALSIEGGQLVLESEQPVAALDLTVSGGNIEWSRELSLFSRKSRGSRTIFYSLMGNVLPAGRTVLGTIGSGADVLSAQLCDQQGQLIATAFGSETTGISTVSVHSAVDTPFDLQGRKTQGQLKHGVYIVNGKKIVK